MKHVEMTAAVCVIRLSCIFLTSSTQSMSQRLSVGGTTSTQPTCYVCKTCSKPLKQIGRSKFFSIAVVPGVLISFLTYSSGIDLTHSIISGAQTITHNDLPLFLWDQSLATPGDLTKGLCHELFLVKVFTYKLHYAQLLISFHPVF